MTLRQQFGRLYRNAMKSTRYIGVGRLPVVRNGRWATVPTEMWDGFVERYEPYMDDTLRRLLSARGVFFDIGAHVGVWSELAARIVGPDGLVVACEPSPAFRLLVAHVGRLAQVRLRNVAVGSAPGTVDFHAQGESTSGSLLPQVTELNRDWQPAVPITAIPVPVTTLDSLAGAEQVTPTVVKLDVEGYELEVLRGSTELLRSAATWVIEIHPPQLRLHGQSDDQVLEVLSSAGHRIEVIDRNPSGLYTVITGRPGAGA